MKNITIRCDVGESIGLGHYYRCSTLKKSFERCGMSVCLALKCFDQDRNDLPYDLLIEGNLSDEYEKYSFNNSYLILDIYHCQNHHNNGFENYLKNLKKYRNRIALIEGLENDECPVTYYPYIDILITPYMNVALKKKHPIHFFGKDFLILDSNRILEQKNIKKIANRILITFGGSDPWNQSVNVLNFLKSDERGKDLEVTVILGPLMRQEHIKAIKEFRNFLKLNVIESAENLREYFEWADVVMTNSGQTRYELAASGVPFIIIPFNEMGYQVSRVFESLNVAYLEQYDKKSSANASMTIIFNILKDYEQRLTMSINGKRNFYNLNGADNLVKNIAEVWL